MMYKETIENKCEVCDKTATIVKVARTKISRQAGMFWRCEDGHYSRTRNYTVKQTKVG